MKSYFKLSPYIVFFLWIDISIRFSLLAQLQTLVNNNIARIHPCRIKQTHRNRDMNSIIECNGNVSRQRKSLYFNFANTFACARRLRLCRTGVGHTRLNAKYQCKPATNRALSTICVWSIRYEIYSNQTIA